MSEGRRKMIEGGGEVIKYLSLWYLVAVQLGNQDESFFYPSGERRLLSLSRSLLGDVQMSARQQYIHLR